MMMMIDSGDVGDDHANDGDDENYAHDDDG